MVRNCASGLALRQSGARLHARQSLWRAARCIAFNKMLRYLAVGHGIDSRYGGHGGVMYDVKNMTWLKLYYLVASVSSQRPCLAPAFIYMISVGHVEHVRLAVRNRGGARYFYVSQD